MHLIVNRSLSKGRKLSKKTVLLILILKYGFILGKEYLNLSAYLNSDVSALATNMMLLPLNQLWLIEMVSSMFRTW